VTQDNDPVNAKLVQVRLANEQEVREQFARKQDSPDPSETVEMRLEPGTDNTAIYEYVDWLSSETRN
jgi:hypothetical protein